MTITILSCISSNSAIGIKQELLFDIKEDLQRFKKLTEGQIVVMGRKTFDSIIERNGRPLPNRLSVVLTRDEEYIPKYGEFVFHSVEKILGHYETMGDSDKKVFVIGGAEIYKEFLPYADEVLLTVVNKHIEEADAFYPMALQQELGFISEGLLAEVFYSERHDAYYKFVKYLKR